MLFSLQTVCGARSKLGVAQPISFAVWANDGFAAQVHLLRSKPLMAMLTLLKLIGSSEHTRLCLGGGGIACDGVPRYKNSAVCSIVLSFDLL